MKEKIFLGVFLLFLLGAANAVELSGDFSLEADSSNIARETFMLLNDSGGRQTYTIKAVGENSSWINLNGKQIGEEALTITLDAGESAELYAFIRPQACYVGPGEYVISLEISNSKTITEEITVEIPESRLLELLIEPLEEEASQCEEMEFEVTVENVGVCSEQVVVSVEGIPQGWFSLDTEQFFLARDSSKTITLAVGPPCNAEVGEHSFTVKAGLKGTTFIAKEQASFEIADEQAIDILWDEMSACLDKEREAVVTITNDGLLTDRLRLSVDGLSWARVAPEEIEIEPGEEAEAKILFSKPGVEEGSYGFSLKARSSKFGKETIEEMSVDIRDCFNVVIEEALVDGEDAEETQAVCIEEKPFYTFTLANDAVETAEVQIGLQGLDALIRPSRVSIEPDDIAEVTVELDLSKEQPGEKAFTFIVLGETFSVRKEYKLVAEDCFGLQVHWGRLVEPVSLDANCKSETFTVKVKNSGTQEQEIIAEVSGPEWIYLDPEDIFIEPGQEKELYIHFVPPYDIEEGKYNASVSIEGEQASARKGLEMNVYGGLFAKIGVASIKAEVSVGEVIERVGKEVKLSLLLSNDSDSALKINSISTKDVNAAVEFEEALLLPGKQISVPITLYLGEDIDVELLKVPLLFETDQGSIERTIDVNLGKEEQLEEDAPVAAVVGFFGLEGMADMLLAGAVVVVIAIFVVWALKTEFSRPEKGSGLASLAKEVQELPGKHLEKIGKHKKPAGKRIRHSTKAAKKKPSLKKKARKKKR